MIIYLCSASEIKLTALNLALATLGFKPKDILMVPSDSGVPAQPFNEEMVKGAKTRIENSWQWFMPDPMSGFLSVENGLIWSNGSWYDQGCVMGYRQWRRPPYVTGFTDMLKVAEDLVTPSRLNPNQTWGETLAELHPEVDPQDPHKYFGRSRVDYLVEPMAACIYSMIR